MSSSRRRPERRLSIAQGRDAREIQLPPSAWKCFLLTSPFIERFFSDGSCIVQLNPDAQLILINSVVDHTDESSAARGGFNVARISALAKLLREQSGSSLRIAMMHHHPVLHSGPFRADKDVIETGDALLTTL